MSTPLVSRAGWGARPPESTPPLISSEGQTVHYGGDSPWGSADRSTPERFEASTDHDRCAVILRAWQAYHMDGPLGADDIAYNSAVCAHSWRYECRGVNRRSAANGTTAGNDRSCATVYIAGGGDPVTDSAKRAFLDEGVRFPRGLRWGHRDWKPTACPGEPLYAWKSAGFPPPPSLRRKPMSLVVQQADSSAFYVIDGGVRIQLSNSNDIAESLMACGQPRVAVWAASTVARVPIALAGHHATVPGYVYVRPHADEALNVDVRSAPPVDVGDITVAVDPATVAAGVQQALREGTG